MVGKTLGHYEILEPLGAGGMGEVYRARDTKLKRDVAIKVLPEELSADPDRLARLEREAHLLAALNHSNIATIHALEADQGTRFLVLELVRGESLEQRLSRGPLPVAEALEICKQVAEALEAAHSEGIIHRDLKPGNVQITPDGRAKVLDFGIAKSMTIDVDIAETAGATNLTVKGTLVGTPSYMSPEQIRDESIDKRADIWAFGCLLYETLTAKSAFGRETLADTLAAIVDQEPDWSTLPAKAPAAIPHLIERCLRKDLRRRLRDIGDAWVEIDEAFAEREDPASGAASVAMERRKLAAAWAITAAASAVTAYALWAATSDSPPSRPVSRFLLDVPLVGISGSAVLVTPDGESLVYALGTLSDYQLHRRRLHELTETPIPGTEGATLPFFSPNGQSLGFVPTPGSQGLALEGQLRQVSMNGGTSGLVAEFFGGRGATWAGDSILFNAGLDTGIHRVAAVGGPVREVTTVDPAEGELAHHWPHALPGGESFLFTSWKGSVPTSEVVAYSPETGVRNTLVTGTDGKYAPSGHLVYVQDASLKAVAFDLEKLEIVGDPVTVIESVYVRGRGAASYSFSETGTLAYVPDPELMLARRRLVWVDRSGKTDPVSGHIEEFGSPRLSPDGTRIALTINDKKVSILELGNDSVSELSPDSGAENSPVWSPDGDWVAFARATVEREGILANDGIAGLFDIYRRRSDFSGPAEAVLTAERGQWPMAWARGGEIAYTELMGVFTFDLRLIGGDAQEPADYVAGPASAGNITISPDGKWAAYESDVSGASEVYVQPFPVGGERTTISNSGGRQPVWSPAGGEIFYRDGNRMMVVDVSTDSGFQAGPTQMLFEKRFLGGASRGYDVSNDGQRFLMVEEIDRVGIYSADLSIVVVLNWFEELKQRVPPGRR